ncbi:MAG: M48 family metallopeptidase, partial [Aureliella sp.]
MAIRFECSGCGVKLSAREDWAGKTGKCRKCGTAFVVPSAAPTPTSKTDSVTSEDLARAFGLPIARSSPSLGYRLSLVAVALVMLLLPLIYLCLVAAVAAAGISYGFYGLRLFENPPQGRRGTGLLMLYLGPLVIAAIVVVFMIKPFFARPPRSGKPRSLLPETQPVLFDFVARICRAVGAPVPKRIDVTADVNASASFRRGWLSLVQSSDLVLTIGIPLVKGLDARELAGVLAHEFGHFTQGVGMRLTYIIRSINLWFARVVYQRDRADEWLKRTAKGSDYRIAVILHLAIAMVAATRGVLWLFMMFGNAVSSLLMRHMEYDADQYEVRLSGSDCFVGTFAKLRRLGLAHAQSLSELQQFFLDGKLVDDLPELICLNRDQQSEEIVTALAASVEEEKGNWYDTHPTDRDRIAAGKKLKADGIFKLDAPAGALFHDLDGLSKAVSKDYYQATFEDQFREDMLASVEQLTSFKQASQAASDARQRMFGKSFTNLRVMHLGQPTDQAQPLSVSAGQLRAARDEMDTRKAEYERASQTFDAADTKWLKGNQALALSRCGVALKAADWQELPIASHEAIAAATRQAQGELAALHEQLLAYEKSFAARVGGAVQWLFTRCRETGDAELSSALERASRVLRCLAATDSTHRAVLDLRNDCASLMAVFATTSGGQKITKAHVPVIQEHVGRITAKVNEILQKFASIPYPFEHASGPIPMGTYLAPEATGELDPDQALETAQGLLGRYQYAYFRSIGTLAAIVEQVEAAAASEPASFAEPHASAAALA